MPSHLPFENLCFISYRSGEHDLTRQFINDLFEGLSGELETLHSGKVFVDWDRLRGGDFFNQALARALCRSVCMVLVYTPMYFDLERPYCAREYRAMLDLEEQRLAALGGPVGSTSGLIIPVVFRGRDRLPQEIVNKRHCHDFGDFTLYGRHMYEHVDYAPKIKEIAEYIRDRCDEFRSKPEAFDDCDSFDFPSEETIRPWLEKVAGSPPPFPRA